MNVWSIKLELKWFMYGYVIEMSYGYIEDPIGMKLLLMEKMWVVFGLGAMYLCGWKLEFICTWSKLECLYKDEHGLKWFKMKLWIKFEDEKGGKMTWV